MSHYKILGRLSQFINQAGLLLTVSLGLLLAALPAAAHHPTGNRTPANFWEGFLSGLAHPIIGPDHFAFIVAIGLLAAVSRQGILIPAAFTVAAMVGAKLHLMQVMISGVELLVSGSILLFGILLLQPQLKTPLVAGLAAMAGLFHGYLYGEAIIGAEMAPQIAYLLGFSVIQMAVALAVFAVGKAVMRRSHAPSGSGVFQPAGWVICGVGLAFLASRVVDLLLPRSLL